MNDFNFPDIDQRPLGSLDLYADIVYCIDCTSSMTPILNKVKETALTLHQQLQQVMQDRYQRIIKKLRIKVIAFRDAYCDGEKSFEVSNFFELPGEAAAFKRFVEGLQAKGGGDLPENSLEAMAMAIRSDWITTIDSSIRKRHIIVMFTDAAAHPLEKAQDGIDIYYPKNMPGSYSELIDWWYQQGSLDGSGASMDQVAKRIVFFTPADCWPWKDATEDFDCSIKCFISPGNGGSDIKTDELMKLLGESMA